MNPSLYEQDYYLWIEQTVKLLQDGKLAELDTPNLIEEIADMGRSERKAIKSNLRVLLMHLLKWYYQSDKRSNSWRTSIVEHRIRIIDDLKDSPSLKSYFIEVFKECYQDAIDLADAETGLNLETFPVELPFTPEEVLNPDYLPE